jgi:hypothetical protein
MMGSAAVSPPHMRYKSMRGAPMKPLLYGSFSEDVCEPPRRESSVGTCIAGHGVAVGKCEVMHVGMVVWPEYL